MIRVDERGAGRPAGRAHAGSCRDVGKRAVAVVAVEDVPAKRGDVHVLVAVVVVVANRDPHAVAGAPDPGSVGDVLEAAVGQLPVKPIVKTRIPLVGGRPARHRIGQRRAVHEEQIEPAVVVVVEHGDASAHGLEQVLLARRRACMNEGNATRLRHVDKADRRAGTLQRRRGEREPGERQRDRAECALTPAETSW